MFTPQETDACRALIALALAEDLGERGDITSQAVIPADLEGAAVFRVKAAGVLAGLPAAELAMQAVDSRVRFETLKSDGTKVAPGDVVAKVAGPMRSVLAAERIALNFVQHLSGIASMTRRYVDAVAGCRAEILDTRKTLPGWRLLAKYAVRAGGGHNHRMGLYDGMLIKDNDLAALPMQDWALQIEEAIRRARDAQPLVPVELEVDNLDQFDIALDCRPAIILLDNMAIEQMRQAVSRRDAKSVSDLDGRTLLEASGGITLDNVRSVAETGVDRISVGALTHSAPALDIGLDYTR